jgi:hypothetical protein
LVLPDGREVIRMPMMKALMSILHRGSHSGPQAMCDKVLRNYGYMGIYTIAKLVCGEDV